MQLDSFQFAMIMGAMILSALAQYLVNSQYNKFSKVRNARNLTGKEIAQSILDKHGYSDIQIVKGNTKLGDHFNPQKNLVVLSAGVHDGYSIAAAAIASHEIGHVIQYKTKYSLIGLRNSMVPYVSFSSSMSWTVLFLGILMSFSGLIVAGIVMLGVVLLFQVFTLPVELNASKRALDILVTDNYIGLEQGPQAKKVLAAAAFTYVVAVIVSIMQILRFLQLFRNRN
ncbi:MAG: zinc metallopeptidase [Erysipelotrichaceae bacterium]